MDNELYQGKYKIHSVRAMWHDYSGGIYFVTICTKDRVHYFGEICRGGATMIYAPIGLYLNECITNITSHCPYAQIPLWQVMPNHVHLIVVIDSEKTPYERRTNKSIENLQQFYGMRRNGVQGRNGALGDGRDGACPVSTGVNQQMQMTDATKGWLSVCIGNLKSEITKFANQNNILFAWQSKFHEHIIRDQDELNMICQYVEGNIGSWEDDCFYV